MVVENLEKVLLSRNKISDISIFDSTYNELGTIQKI